MNRPAKGVVVLSPPSSGNRLIAETLRRCGVRKLMFQHGSAKPEQLHKLLAFQPDAIVTMVRSPRCWEASCRKRWSDFPTPRSRLWMGKSRPGDVYAAHYSTVCKFAAETGLPVYPVSYEALCEDPVGVVRALCDWLGLDYVPFPTTGKNEKGPIRNGNTPYLEAARVRMGGPEGEIEVHESEIADYERRGYWHVESEEVAV